MNTDSEAAFARLQRVNWDACGNGVFRPELEQLFFDYIAVARDICRRIGSKSDLYNHLSGLFDYVPHLYADAHPLSESVTMWIEQHVMEHYKWRSRWYVTPAAYGFVLWYELSAAERAHLCGDAAAPNPYLKLIEFFEAGGAFSCEHNMLDRIYPLSPEDPWYGRDNSTAKSFPTA